MNTHLLKNPWIVAAAAAIAGGVLYGVLVSRPAPEEVPAGEKPEIAGRVVSADGTSLPGAEVEIRTLAGEVVASLRVDHTGSFRASLEDPGVYRVELRAPGHARTRFLVSVAGREEVELRLLPDRYESPRAGEGALPAAAISGQARVLDPERRPVAGARVSVRRVDLALDGRGVLERAVLARTLSAGDGSFEIAFQASGAAEDAVERLHYLEIEAAGYALLSSRIEGPSEGEFVLAPGEARAIRVRDASTGEPVRGAAVEVMLDRPAPGGSWEGVSGEDGTLLLVLPREGSGTLHATAPDHGPGVLEVGIPSDRPVWEIRLEPLPRLAGRVLDAESGEGLPGAEVEVRQGSYRRVGRTGERGRFEIAVAGPGPFRIEARRENYAPGEFEGEAPAPREIEVPLTRGRAIEVRVVDEGGRPLAGARVRVRGATRLARSASGRTDAGGRFSTPVLAAGEEYEVRAEHAEASLARVVTPLPAWAPGTPLALEIRLGRGGTVAGRVVDRALGPVPGAWVAAHAIPPSVPVDAAEVSTDGAGLFRLGPLVPGTYRIEVAAPPGLAPGVLPAAEVEPGLESALGDLVLVPAAGVEGELASPGPLPTAATIVWSGASKGSRTVSLARGAGFRVADLPPGFYSFEARVPGYAPARPEPFRLEAGQTARVVFALEEGLVLAGAVRDARGAPAAGARLRVEPAGKVPSGGSVEATADESGRFAIRGLAPGDYDVRAGLPGRPPVLVRLGLDRTVEDLALVLPAGARLRGVVLDAGGEPIPGAMVQVEGAKRVQARTDSEGTFEFDDLSPGRLTIRAYVVEKEPPRTRRGSVALEVADGETRAVEVRIAR